MHEQIARTVYYCGVHLLYASMVWVAAWVVTSIPRGSATVKHWIWFATSLNFVLPAGAMLDRLFAGHLSWARPLGFIGGLGVQIAESTVVASTVAAVWLLGASLMAARLCARLRNEHRHLRAIDGAGARGSFVAHGVTVRIDAASEAPVVDGLLRAHISLPRGIERLLSKPELEAVLIHEATHARRRDNLIRLVHEAGLCVLWFHPLVWITGSRLALYRELSCDESVIRCAHGPDLVSALAKLANPERPFLLQAGASSFLGHRLERLAAPEAQGGRAMALLLPAVFGIALAGGIWGTVSHTACCFLLRK
jgi:beta-lactamase regulating signal transducer with metallopeptidase domain